VPDPWADAGGATTANPLASDAARTRDRILMVDSSMHVDAARTVLLYATVLSDAARLLLSETTSFAPRGHA